MSEKPITTIGILAHVDAGKTTLTEALLYTAGATSKLGSVDQGSAITDSLAMEKNRGISIKTASVEFEWEGQKFNLVDTPGHIDFSAEVDRALSVLDMAILVVSAKEGVQAHTLNLWETLRERQLPVLVFINKIDRDGVDLEQVFSSFEKDLGTKLFALNHADLSDPGHPSLLNFGVSAKHIDPTIHEKSLENLAEIDDSFLEDFLEGNTSDTQSILEKVSKQIKSQNIVGTIFGSAKLDLGIEFLLHKIATYAPSASKPIAEPCAQVFKVVFNPKLGRLAHIKSLGSTIAAKDTIWSEALGKEIKINQIFKNDLGKIKQTQSLSTGEIGIITTSDVVLAGHVLGKSDLQEKYNPLVHSVLSVQAVAEEEKDYQKLGEALELLNIEDPTLNFEWYKEEREFHLNILGPIQTEVLKESLVTRFEIAANFLSPTVVYKETPSQSAEGFVRYWMPKPCWAIMTFGIKPGQLGSGVSFTSKVPTKSISVKYQNEVKRAIPWSLAQGVKGWEVTDLEITLLDGSEHTVHSNPGDFLLATPMGILRGLENADTDLLEPIYAFQIKAKQDLLGPISSDLIQMKAQLDPPNFEADFFTLTGRVSVAEAMEYSIKFNATTSGKGRLKLTLDGFEKTETTPEKIRAFKGVSPLDEAQWILHKRGAFKADER